jgi:hypothetical protein
VPRAGPIKGNQYRTITRSVLLFLISLPAFIQLSGLIELIMLLIFSPAGAGSFVNCDFPGNRNEGY